MLNVLDVLYVHNVPVRPCFGLCWTYSAYVSMYVIQQPAMLCTIATNCLVHEFMVLPPVVKS